MWLQDLTLSMKSESNEMKNRKRDEEQCTKTGKTKRNPKGSTDSSIRHLDVESRSIGEIVIEHTSSNPSPS